MKKIIYLLIAIIGIASCSDNLESLNENKKDPLSVPGEALFTSAQKSLVDLMVSTNVNRNIFRLVMQQWTETTYTDESNYDIVTRNIPQSQWDALYKDVLKDLDEASKVIEETPLLATDDPAQKANKLAIIEILNVYAYSVLVDTFGDVPYSEALDSDNLLPRYDDDAAIYRDLIARINTAIDQLNTSSASFGIQDNMYNGDVSKWLKFGNSLKLKMGITISDLSSEAALAQATIEDAATNVFESNEDNAALTYLSATPNTNPVYVDLTLSGRDDFVPTSTIVDQMQPRTYEILEDSNEDGVIDENDNETVVPGSVTYTDPRAKFYFDNNVDADESIAQTVYLGGTPGASNSYSDFTHISEKISKDPTLEGVIMDYAEVKFLLAEAAARGYVVPGTVETNYNDAIEASILYWGGTMDEAATHLARTEVAYATASGDWKEKIGTQKWIALYNRGYAAWNSWKLLDYPVLELPADPVSDTPVRYTYPIVEQTLNGSSYGAASAAIGGDLVTTKVFWDVN
ncbi:SusD/RagB family nutrient-binding outer membrane lipoprotein [Aquimarina intermedia]|uniref:SusD-like starch-binding protein associating with outer membrane n=1 Tax=Aquimarina intermedia TaxID=350814 RepID=A0A5S5C305_9FLAO|nr:SusD/RagB family nutrient-binding outer membrane lipoprotein [Aquimarina intermedia]TYP72862.1 SusD-like starch-binding protein associating with outer membrane [Aquimarina intermedia]